MSKTQEKIKELKIINWILLGIISTLLLSVAGWFYLQNQDKLNADFLESVRDNSVTIETNTSSDDSKVEVEKEVDELDQMINSSKDDDLNADEINDSSLGL